MKAASRKLPADLADSLSQLQTAALTQVRLDARHGQGPLSQGWIRQICREHYLEPEQVRNAERRGREQRAKGVPCLCPRCGSSGEQINDRERVRQAWAEARNAQLLEAGVSPEERARIIAAEIDAGAAFQALPVTVTRSNT